MFRWCTCFRPVAPESDELNSSVSYTHEHNKQQEIERAVSDSTLARNSNSKRRKKRNEIRDSSIQVKKEKSAAASLGLSRVQEHALKQLMKACAQHQKDLLILTQNLLATRAAVPLNIWLHHLGEHDVEIDATLRVKLSQLVDDGAGPGQAALDLAQTVKQVTFLSEQLAKKQAEKKARLALQQSPQLARKIHTILGSLPQDHKDKASQLQPSQMEEFVMSGLPTGTRARYVEIPTGGDHIEVPVWSLRAIRHKQQQLDKLKEEEDSKEALQSFAKQIRRRSIMHQQFIVGMALGKLLEAAHGGKDGATQVEGASKPVSRQGSIIKVLRTFASRAATMNDPPQEVDQALSNLDYPEISPADYSSQSSQQSDIDEQPHANGDASSVEIVDAAGSLRLESSRWFQAENEWLHGSTPATPDDNHPTEESDLSHPGSVIHFPSKVHRRQGRAHTWHHSAELDNIINDACRPSTSCMRTSHPAGGSLWGPATIPVPPTAVTINRPSSSHQSHVIGWSESYGHHDVEEMLCATGADSQQAAAPCQSGKSSPDACSADRQHAHHSTLTPAAFIH